jgi:hypothetical protein
MENSINFTYLPTIEEYTEERLARKQYVTELNLNFIKGNIISFIAVAFIVAGIFIFNITGNNTFNSYAQVCYIIAFLNTGLFIYGAPKYAPYVFFPRFFERLKAINDFKKGGLVTKSKEINIDHEKITVKTLNYVAEVNIKNLIAAINSTDLFIFSADDNTIISAPKRLLNETEIKELTDFLKTELSEKYREIKL